MLQLVFGTAHIFGTSKNLKKNLLNLNEMSIYNYIFLELK